MRPIAVSPATTNSSKCASIHVAIGFSRTFFRKAKRPSGCVSGGGTFGRKSGVVVGGARGSVSSIGRRTTSAVTECAMRHPPFRAGIALVIVLR
ncbi:UNVERIFIED_ORG: hypothetical protein M2442_003871 [Methylorubrum zatmanii]|nr:hypothetical protein [Methylorubrum zatmanii]